MFAAEHGKAAVARFLVKAHANPLARAKNGKTPLHHAAQHGFASIVTFLLSLPSPFQPDLSLVDNRGRTALRLSLETIARKHSKFGKTRKIMANSSRWNTAHALLSASTSLDNFDVSLVEDVCFIPPARRRRRTERMSNLFEVLEKRVPAIVSQIVFDYDDIWYLSDGLWKLTIGKMRKMSSENPLDGTDPSKSAGKTQKNNNANSCKGFVFCGKRFVLDDNKKSK
mmetsp:Transcript_16585/g.33575  ORF Transcript_16585/g.33575 Transcript_16585/m.33575 type:complete len:226 (-) Transcript_16585:68-745(-)